MMNMSSVSLISLLLLVSVSFSNEDAQKTLQTAMASNIECRDRILKGCRFNISVTGKKMTPDGWKIFSSAKNHVHLAPSRWLEESGSDGEKEPWPMEVQGFNPRYGFELHRTKQSNRQEKTSWALTDQYVNNPSRIRLRRRYKRLSQLTPDELVTIGVLPFVGVESIPCDRLFNHPSFKAKQIQRDKERLRIQFESDVQYYVGPDRVLRGTLWLLPESSWVMDEYRITILSSGVELPVEMKMEWRNLAELPEPAKATFNYHSKKGLIVWESQFSDWMLGEESPERFTLSHYGLPEPKQRHMPGPTRWYRYAAVTALICLTLAAWLRWRTKRTERANERPQPEQS